MGSPKTPDPLSPVPWHCLSSGGCQVIAPWTVLGEILKLEPQHVTGVDAMRAQEPQNSPPGQQPLCGLRGVGLTSKNSFHPPRLGLIDSQGESRLYLGQGPISNFESSASLCGGREGARHCVTQNSTTTNRGYYSHFQRSPLRLRMVNSHAQGHVDARSTGL